MATKAKTKDDMTHEQFGRTYSYYEDQLDAIDSALIYLGAREISGDPAEQPDVLRLEAELNRRRGQIQRQFDWFLSSDVAVTPPTPAQSNEIEDLMNKVEALTNQQRLADTTLALVNELADTATALDQG
jgi:hypothetical protein